MKFAPRALVYLAALTALAATAQAQKAPRIGYVYPAGGRQGASFEVTIGGQGLTGASEVYFTGRGVEATVVANERPLSAKETELLREKLRQMEEEKKTAPGGSDEIAELKEKLACFGTGRPFNVAIAENVTLRVKVAPDATLGDQEIRLATPGGLSNPLFFHIGQLPEFSKAPARGSLKAEISSGPRRTRKRPQKAEVLETITLPAVLNGQVLAGETDRFRFKAKRGQRVVVSAWARKLIPYLPDAVPGWFQATIAIFDASGRELAYADDFRFNPDPVLAYQVPADGEYEIAVRDSIYRGREDFVYRITVGELPFITSIFPLGGAVGTECRVQLAGWNLPYSTLALDLRNAKPGLQPLVAIRERTVSNFVSLAVDESSETLDKEPNDAPTAAQALTIPIAVNGRIDRAGDTDIFRIEGKAGSEIVAEIRARRLNSPLDSVLKLTDAEGKQIAMNDDSEDKGAGLTTHHADSRLAAKLPADGAYFLHVTDAQHGGSPDHAYRLRVSAPQPDFELRVAPSSVTGRAGGRVPITVYALRKDGFDGEIKVSLKNAPEGFRLAGGRIPAGKDQEKVTLELGDAQSDPLAIEIEGRASIAGKETVRQAIPAEDMQQAFAYHHLVPAREMRVAVAGRLSTDGKVKIANEMPLKIPLGGSVRVQVAAAIGNKVRGIELELIDPPAGIAAKTLSTSPDGAEIELHNDASKSISGEKGNLTVHAFLARSNANGKTRRIPLGALPTISFEIVDR